MRLVAKGISLIIIICLIITTTVFAGSFTDVPDDSSFAEAIETLTALGLLKGYEDGTFKPENTITRAEFAAVITRTLGLANLQSDGAVTIFSDVPSSHWASSNIKFATDLGIIKGFGDGTFLPDIPVTYEQAVKMIVAALGYEYQADNYGGYPSGYLMVASEKGITKNAQGEVGQNALRGLVAQLIFNSLDIPLVDKSGDGENISYKVNEEKSILKTCLNITQVKSGQITANEYTSLKSPVTKVEAGEIEIDNTIFKTNDNSLSQYLGYEVTYYYKEDTDTDDMILVSAIIKNRKDKILHIKAEQINNYEGNVLEYFLDDGKKEDDTVRISEDAIFIYNGVFYDNESEPIDLKIEAGDLKLLSSKGSSNYDIIFVNEYKNYVVENTPNTTDYLIIDKYFGERVTLNPTDSNTNLIITKDGSPIQYTDIKKGNIISVAQSKNTEGRKLIKVLVSSNTVTGTITESYDDIRVINNKEYKIAPSYLRAISEKGNRNIGIDDSGTFYLDPEGKIASFVLTASRSTNYAYLMDVREVRSGLDSYVIFDLYIPSSSTSGSYQKIQGAEKIKIDGDNVDSVSEVFSKLAKSAKDTNKDIQNEEKRPKYSQLIKYAKNSSGRIDLIDTVTPQSNETDDNLKKNFEYDGNSSPELTYESSNKTFNLSGKTQFIINSDTKIFRIPEDRSDKDSYGMKSYTYFKNGYKYKLAAFDVSSTSKVAKALLLYGEDEDEKINDSTPVVIFDSSKKVTNSNGEAVTRMTYYYNGTTATADVEIGSGMESVANSLTQGDIIRFSKKSNGFVNHIDILLETSKLVKHEEKFKPEGSIYFKAVYGIVYNKQDDNAYIRVYPGDDITADTVFDSKMEEQLVSYQLTSSTKCYEINITKNKDKIVVKSKPEELIITGYDIAKEKATLIFLYTYDKTVRAVFVINRS